MGNLTTFSKKYSTPKELVDILAERGLEFDDRSRAEAYIKRIGYYRFSAYSYPLLKTPKTLQQFKEGSSFDLALDMYRFDRHLRLLMFNQIEKIEVAVRSAIVNITSKETQDPFWMTNPKYFANEKKFQKTLELIKIEYGRSKEDFIEHFRNTYSDSFPPAWIIAEILPLGVLTRVYDNLASNKIRKLIAQEFDLNIPVFTSWMTIITVTRNSCCHHARVWNKVWSLRALYMKKMTRPWVSSDVKQGRIFFTLCIIKYFVNIIAPKNDMTAKLRWLFTDYPNIDAKAMGFPNIWEMEPLWR